MSGVDRVIEALSRGYLVKSKIGGGGYRFKSWGNRCSRKQGRTFSPQSVFKVVNQGVATRVLHFYKSGEVVEIVKHVNNLERKLG